jgi:N utilization substance protein A
VKIDLSALTALENIEHVRRSALLGAISAALLDSYRELTKVDGPARVEIDRTDGTVTVLRLEKDEDGNTTGEFDDTPEDFGRAAAKAVRDAIRGQINIARADTTYTKYADLEGTVVSGVVNRDARANDRGITVVHLGTEADGQDGLILAAEHMPGEKLEHGDRVKCYVTAVNRGQRGVQILLSRTHPELVRGLFALEVPEVADGSVDITAIAREAGHRSKMAVHLHGQRSQRQGRLHRSARSAGLGDHGSSGRREDRYRRLLGPSRKCTSETRWPRRRWSGSMSPTMTCRSPGPIVPDHQLSLAIGKEGQNARLAARLTGWKIDIRPESAPDDGADGADGAGSSDGTDEALPQI